MSSSYIKLGNRSLDQWKVTELKEELKKRKLTSSGLKQDLVKRLDKAIRIEMESSMDNAEEDATKSEVPVEKSNADNISEKAKEFLDEKIDLVEKVEPKSGHDVDNCRVLSVEGNFVEADLAHRVDATGLEREQVPEPSVMEITVDPVMPSTESDSQNHGTNEDIAASAFLINDGHPQEDVKLELSGPNSQSPQINERSTPVVPLNGQNLLNSETQNEAIHSKDQGENDGSKCLQPDPTGQPLNHQVSDVDTNLGFQVTSDYVSTESVSITAKNELKMDVIDDDVELEQDVKPEMVLQPPSSAVRDGGESHPMDIGETLDKKDITDHFDNKDVEEPHDKNLCIESTDGCEVENVDSLKSIDGGDIGHPEKLNLDRSSGDDSMEEDVMESKHVDDKSDSFTDNKSGTPSAKEEDHVDVVGHDKPVEMVEHVEMKATDIGNETASTLTSGKRKIIDKEAVSNNDAAKKMRRWNAEGFNSSQIGSTTRKGSSEPGLKSIPGTNTITSVEAPKERVVPPASRLPTNSLRIDRFLRPFTLKAVQELLGKSGTVTSFWMDHIKTHCYVSYSSVEEAAETRNAVYNLQWPPNGGRLLVAEFVDPEEVKSRIEAPLASLAIPSTSTTPTQTPSAAQSAAQPSPRQQIPTPLPPPPLSNPPHIRERLHQPQPGDRLNLPPPPPLPEKVDPPILTLDDLFQKTKATPRIYYLPLSDEIVAAKMKTQGKNVAQ